MRYAFMFGPNRYSQLPVRYTEKNMADLTGVSVRWSPNLSKPTPIAQLLLQ